MHVGGGIVYSGYAHLDNELYVYIIRRQNTDIEHLYILQEPVFVRILTPHNSDNHSKKYQNQQDNELYRLCILDMGNLSILA